jgi:hypothetical protein
MSAVDYIELLPNSILKFGTGSNNRKLWTLFANQIDEIDQMFEDMLLLRDISSQSGAILDLIGKILHEKRNGKTDVSYRIYLTIAIMKMLSNGSIPILNNIFRAVLEDDFIGIRNLYPSQESQSWGSDTEYQFWLDGTWYLDGIYMLAGNVFQPAFFEVRINAGTSETLKTYLKEIITHIKGGGISYRFIEV